MNHIIKIWEAKLLNAKTEEQRIFIQQEIEKRKNLFPDEYADADNNMTVEEFTKPSENLSPVQIDLLAKRDKLAAKIQKFGFTELQPELDKLNLQIESVVNCDAPTVMKKFNTHFGEVTWNQETGKIICRNCEFTESEIMAVSNAGLSLSEMDFEIKKHFPDAQLTITERDAA